MKVKLEKWAFVCWSCLLVSVPSLGEEIEADAFLSVLDEYEHSQSVLRSISWVEKRPILNATKSTDIIAVSPLICSSIEST